MRSGRNRGSIADASGVSGSAMWTTSLSSGAIGSSSGSRRRNASSRAAAISSGSPRSMPNAARTGSRSMR